MEHRYGLYVFSISDTGNSQVHQYNGTLLNCRIFRQQPSLCFSSELKMWYCSTSKAAVYSVCCFCRHVYALTSVKNSANIFPLCPHYASIRGSSLLIGPAAAETMLFVPSPPADYSKKSWNLAHTLIPRTHMKVTNGCIQV